METECTMANSTGGQVGGALRAELEEESKVDVAPLSDACPNANEGSTVHSPPGGWPQQRSPSSPSLHFSQFAAVPVLNSAGKAPTGSVDLRRAELPPGPEVVVRPLTDPAQSRVRTSPPWRATTSCKIRPGKFSVDSATPTDMPETNQRSSAPELEADPNNASWVNGNDRGAPGDLECERTPSAVVAEAGARVPGGGAGDGGQPWPGPDFKLQQVLEGSVYLWACGEQGNEGGAKCQALCYIELILVSKSRYLSDSDQGATSNENQVSSATDSPAAGYSIVAIAVAMYLAMSIAAADLWGGVALVVEGHDSGGIWFVRRKVFGVFLLCTFLLLTSASTRVLFYSSFEDVEVVIGAAAVLFIADVDEKLMMVLKNVRGEWRLFWVLEAIGLSFGLAVLVVKVTGNDGAVDNHEEERRCAREQSGMGCGVYDFFFILNHHPTAVTVCALLLTSAFSRPKPFFRRCLPSRFTLFLFLWVGTAPPSPLWSGFRWYVGVLSGCCALVYACLNHRAVKQALSGANGRLRLADRRRRAILFGGGVVLQVVLMFLPVFTVSSQLFWDIFLALSGCLSFLTRGWLVGGMGLASFRSTEYQLPHASNQSAPLPRMVPILLGWLCGEVLNATRTFWGVFIGGGYVTLVLQQLVNLAGELVVGTFLWGGVAGDRGVAYWAAATVLRDDVALCALTWVEAKIGNKL